MNNLDQLNSYINKQLFKLDANFNPPPYVEFDPIYDDPKQFKQLSQHERALLVSWILTSLAPTNGINHRHNSYEIKHSFSNSSLGFYVSNGQFKGAMLVAGFKTDKVKQRNWCFNVSEKSYNNVRRANSHTTYIGALTEKTYKEKQTI